MSSEGTLAKGKELSPATPQVDALVFAAAPDTQALSVQGAKYPVLQLDDGAGTLYYNGTGKDYVVDVDADGYAVSITTIAGGALDAGGNADCTYKKAFFDADDVSDWYPVSNAEAIRVTCDCGAGGPASFTLEGRSEPTGTEYPLGTAAVVVAATEAFTRNVAERVQAVRVDMTGVTGPVKVLVQESN